MPSLKYPIEIAYCISHEGFSFKRNYGTQCSWGSEHKIWCNKLMRLKGHKGDIPL